MAPQRTGPAGPTGPSAGDPLLETAGCCGLIARLLGAGALLGALVTLGFLLVTGPPDRWQGIADPNAHPIAVVVDPTYSRTVYVTTEQGFILITRDGGQSWQKASHGLPSNTPISALAVVPRDTGDTGDTGATQLLAGTSKGAYMSADGGQTWRGAGPGITAPSIVDAVSALPDGMLLAGTTAHGLYVLPADGTTWVPATRGLPPQSDIYAFLPLAQPGRVLAALISGGIYASRDDGMTWAESDQGLSGASGVNVFSLLALPGRGGGTHTDAVLLAGTSRGIYMSRDLGATWTGSSAGIGTTRVISLARDPLSRTDVVAGTDTGVYESRDGGVTWHALGFGLPAEQHVGAVAVVHPAGGEQVILASVDQLYRYPGQWPLAPDLWRALGFGALVVLALSFIALIVWQARSVMAG